MAHNIIHNLQKIDRFHSKLVSFYCKSQTYLDKHARVLQNPDITSP